jgi:peroxiredoxin
MGMEVKKNNLGFGVRSWRYAAIINNGTIEKVFEESGKSDNFSDDPYQETSPDNILSYLNMKSTKSA